MSKRQIETGATTKIVVHETIEEAVASFVPKMFMDEPEDWHIGCDDSGDGRVYTISEFIETIRKNQPCWGCCKQNANEIHVWIGPEALTEDILGLFAHEFGHLEPWLASEKDHEEQRSESFSRVAVRAWGATYEVMERRTK